eukprot:6205380-Pleurochrysis_carterae.AAC.4
MEVCSRGWQLRMLGSGAKLSFTLVGTASVTRPDFVSFSSRICARKREEVGDVKPCDMTGWHAAHTHGITGSDEE